MKKAIYILLLFPIFLISCEIETSSNGKLDGNWQLQSFDTLSTGGVCDMKKSGIYWGIENNLLQVKTIGKTNRILFRFEKNEDALTIHSPHIFESQYVTVPLEDESQLIPFGIHGSKETFTIDVLSNSHLVLTNQQLRLRFRRY